MCYLRVSLRSSVRSPRQSRLPKMARFCALVLLLAIPALAVRVDEADSLDEDEIMSPSQLAVARAELGAELLDEDIVAHGSALLSMFSNLTVSPEVVSGKLAKNPELKELVKKDLTSGPAARNDAMRASLLERARDTVSAEEAAGFEQSLRRKDSTPCACFLEAYTFSNGYQQQRIPLVDLDRQQGWGNCAHTCLDHCKQGGQNRKFIMDPREAQQIGADGVMQEVVAGQCKGGCNCLDATQSVRQVNNAKRQIGKNIDAAFQKHVFGTESECMQSCPHMCGDGGGMDYEGLCIDELYGM